MKRILAIVAIASAFVFCLVGTGCAPSNGSSDNAITVSASAKAQTVADSVKITIHVRGEGETDAQAQESLDGKNAQIADILKAAGVAEQDITFTQGEGEPVWGGYGEEEVMGGYWDWDGNWIETGYETWIVDRTGEIVGYGIPGTIVVANIPATELGAALSECAAQGITEFTDLSFHIAEGDAAYKEALASAVDAAKAKAETLAKASGVYVGGVVNMIEESDATQMKLEIKGDASKLDPNNIESLDLELPSITIEAAVTVSYAIS